MRARNSNIMIETEARTHQVGRIASDAETMTTTIKLLTVSELARWLSVSPSWVRDHATGRRRPVLPCVKLGKSLRFEPAVISQWLEALRRAGRAA
jgi:hypothetical protein